ncbi:hypothetical protein PMZ80_000264 [Knufia obscura]|uniref:Uncharacterized protein n=1 Tax=Knufia obscura TaxID=1635080 RepID=A0ABR0RZT9_9EURO|nr:hypothetical protein PMZ80_000264 [Knufia obscura]
MSQYGYHDGMYSSDSEYSIVPISSDSSEYARPTGGCTRHSKRNCPRRQRQYSDSGYSSITQGMSGLSMDSRSGYTPSRSQSVRSRVPPRAPMPPPAVHSSEYDEYSESEDGYSRSRASSSRSHSRTPSRVPSGRSYSRAPSSRSRYIDDYEPSSRAAPPPSRSMSRSRSTRGPSSQRYLEPEYPTPEPSRSTSRRGPSSRQPQPEPEYEDEYEDEYEYNGPQAGEKSVAQIQSEIAQVNREQARLYKIRTGGGAGGGSRRRGDGGRVKGERTTAAFLKVAGMFL